MVDMHTTIRFAVPDDAPALLRVIRAAFEARPPVDPPAEALADDENSIRDALTRGHGVVVERDGSPVACLLVGVDGDTATLCRVSVDPAARGEGLGVSMVAQTLVALGELGLTRVEVVARREFPDNVSWWERAGFTTLRAHPTGWVLGRSLPIAIRVPDADAMRALGASLARVLRAGDVIIASGELGAGKTTLTQGIGAGLGVEGPVISPTFVLSRVHPATGDGPALVHVDAYRVAGPEELADIDLDETRPSAVTLVEWGRDRAEWLSDERLEIDIALSGDPDDPTRTVHLLGIGERWRGALDHLREQA